MRRIRLGTLLLVIVILAEGIALYVTHQRAKRREAQFQHVLLLYTDRATESMRDNLDTPRRFDYKLGTRLEDVLKLVRTQTKSSGTPGGFPIYVDPVGLQESGSTLGTTVGTPPSLEMLTLGEHLHRILKPLKLAYKVENGLFLITSPESLDEATIDGMREEDFRRLNDNILK